MSRNLGFRNPPQYLTVTCRLLEIGRMIVANERNYHFIDMATSLSQFLNKQAKRRCVVVKDNYPLGITRILLHSCPRPTWNAEPVVKPQTAPAISCPNAYSAVSLVNPMALRFKGI